MELKPGYKHTELGPLPEDWSLGLVGDLGKLFGGLSGKSSSDFSSDAQGRYVPFTNVMANITVDWEQLDGVKIDEHEKQNTLEEGDLIFNGSSETSEELGMCSHVKGVSAPIYLNSFCFGMRPVKAGVFNSSYLAYWFRSPSGRSVLSRIAQGSTRYNVSKSLFRTIRLPLPPLEEQEAIAEVLGDVDAQIRANEQLIEKLTNEKEGLSTQLLNGTIRLNGADTTKRKHTELGLLPEDWEVVPLAKILDVCHGKSQKEVEDVNGEFPIYGTGGLMGFANDYLHKGPTVMIGRKGTIDRPRYSEGPVWTVDTLFYCDCSDRLLPRFAFEAFKRIPWRNFNEASGVPSLSSKTIGTIQIPLPPLEEQEAIAEVLGDVDSQIAAAKKLSVKLKAKKSGLMQLLLTGKIRLA